jgi:hypothetical protein
VELLPWRAEIAFWAAASEHICTNPNCLLLPLQSSYTTLHDSTGPYCENTLSKSAALTKSSRFCTHELHPFSITLQTKEQKEMLADRVEMGQTLTYRLPTPVFLENGSRLIHMIRIGFPISTLWFIALIAVSA